MKPFTIKNIWMSDNFKKQLGTCEKFNVTKVKGETTTTVTYDKDNFLKYKPMPIETVMGTLADLIAKQQNGEDGVLLNSYKYNVFYATCTDEIVRAVLCIWDAGDSKWCLNC